MAMAGQDFDPRIIFGGLMERILCPAQAAALFRENMVGARYFLTGQLAESSCHQGVKPVIFIAP
jgi:hypothetical protein